MSNDKIPYINGYEMGGFVDGYQEEYKYGKYVPSYTSEDFLHHDPHDVTTVQLNELIEYGFVEWYTIDGEEVIPNNEWVWDYFDINQYKRVCDKFNERYYWDEIGILPPLKWKQQLIRRINEIMPKYKIIYQAIEDGIDMIQTSSRYGKSRDIFSEFPETLLNGNSDYISNGTDREHEDVDLGDTIDKFKQIGYNYEDVDVMILEELEEFFSCLYTVNANGF